MTDKDCFIKTETRVGFHKFHIKKEVKSLSVKQLQVFPVYFPSWKPPF